MSTVNFALALGIDLGGSSVKSVWVNANGGVLARETTGFDAANPMEWAATIRGLLGRPPDGVDPRLRRC